jgi:predicted nucleic acid-binding protein
MTVLIDTNIVLDVLLNNASFIDNARIILKLAEQKQFIGYISASAITDIFYISQKKLGKKAAQEAIKHLLYIFYPATVTDSNIYHALELNWNDFEDSVQFAVGEALSADYIITRNSQDFTSGSISAVTPGQFIKAITSITK